MSTTIQETHNTPGVTPYGSYGTGEGVGKSGSTEVIPGSTETTQGLGGAGGNVELPQLKKPLMVGNSMSGLSLETLLDAVGFEQRQTEVKSGTAVLEANAQERAEAAKKEIDTMLENLEKAAKNKVLNGFLKAFKIIGMVLAAVASVAMIAVGAVGMAAGGSGAALIAVGVASMVMLASNITESATDGKAGFGPGFIAGKIAEAAGGSEQAVGWTKMAVDIAATVALMVLSFGTSAGTAVGNATSTATKAAGQTFKTVANVVSKVSMSVSAGMGVASSATNVVKAFNDRDISFLKAQQKRLQAIMERIALSNDLTLDHIKTMMERTEETLQTVSDIVKQGAEANTAVTTGMPPAMA